VAYLKVQSWHSSTESLLKPGMYGGERYPFWQYKACQIFLTFLFFHLVICLTTGPKTLPKRTLHIERSRASSFKWQYPLLSLRSSSNFLRLLPRLPVPSIPPFIFPSIIRCKRQFLRKMWPVRLAFRLPISCNGRF